MVRHTSARSRESNSPAPWDDSIGNTDFPGLWRLSNRDGYLLHSGGEARTLYGVIATSAIGAGSLPAGEFEKTNRRIEIYDTTLRDGWDLVIGSLMKGLYS